MNSLRLNSILLVDDDEISNLFNTIFIGQLGLNVNVDIALNGQEALDLLLTSKHYSTIVLPCLLLLDIQMPIMDGWEFLKAYDQRVDPEVQSKITIVMLTTSENESDLVKAENSIHVKGLMQKPLSESKFKGLIKKFY